MKTSTLRTPDVNEVWMHTIKHSMYPHTIEKYLYITKKSNYKDDTVDMVCLYSPIEEMDENGKPLLLNQFGGACQFFHIVGQKCIGSQNIFDGQSGWSFESNNAEQFMHEYVEKIKDAYSQKMAETFQRLDNDKQLMFKKMQQLR